MVGDRFVLLDRADGLTEAERAWSLGAWCDRADFSINDLLPPETWS